MDAVGQLAQLGRGPGEPLAHVLEEGDGRVRVALGPRPRQADLERERHQVLLRAVVQVALDAPARRVGRLDDPRLRCAQLLQPRALDLVARAAPPRWRAAR